MFEQIKFILIGLKENPLPTICGLLIGAVMYMWIENTSVRGKIETMAERHRIDLLDCEKSHAKEMKAMLEQVNSDLRAAAERQTKIEEEQKRIKKSRR